MKTSIHELKKFSYDGNGASGFAATYASDPLGIFEDRFSFSRWFPIFAIADGVRQLSYTKREMRTGASKAGRAAELFCRFAVKEIERRYESPTHENPIGKTISAANSRIRELNRMLGIEPDFWKTDYAGCNAAIAYILNGKLYWGFVGDTFVSVLSEDGEWRIPVVDDYAPVHNFWKDIKSFELREFITRAFIRNRDEIFDKEGREISYGSLTGESSALRFLRVGSVELESGDLIFLGSDGLMPYLAERRFLSATQKSDEDVANMFRRGFNQQERFLQERTMILVRYY